MESRRQRRDERTSHRESQVILEGQPYGFLGGASGKVGNTIIFNGDITRHSDYEAIREFIESRGLDICIL